MTQAKIISTNIISSLGFSTEEVFDAVCEGSSGLERRICYIDGIDGADGVEELVSCVDDRSVDGLFANICHDVEHYTKFEKMTILSINDAARRAAVDLSSPRVLIILSTTKGNIELLSQNNTSHQRVMLWDSAERIARFFSTQTTPIIISNACISGVSAIILAARYIADKVYDSVVVVGCDVVSRFVVAGFSSFKALSPQRCAPFDRDRAGLNLGEAAATIVLQGCDDEKIADGALYIHSGAITNDATHISAPSRTGQGLYDAIVRCDTSNIDFVQVHGTATIYNDQMEATALSRANLDQVPALSLKWHFGHTLGAAGLVETIIGCQMLSEGLLLPSMGCENQDDKCPILLSKQKKPQPMSAFLKTISGFGGCNAALVVRKKV